MRQKQASLFVFSCLVSVASHAAPALGGDRLGPTEAPPSTATCLHGDMPACTATCVRAHGSVHRHGNVPCIVTLGDEQSVLSCKRGQLVSDVVGNHLPRLVASYLPGVLEISFRYSPSGPRPVSGVSRGRRFEAACLTVLYFREATRPNQSLPR